MPHQWIDKLQAANSKKHKEEILAESYTACKLGSKNACNFLKFLSIGLNPFINFYTNDVPISYDRKNTKNSWKFLEFLLYDLSEKRIGGNNAKNQIYEMSKDFDSENWNKFVRPLLLNNFEYGITRENLNNKLRNTEYEVPEFKVMEPSKSSEHKDKLFGKHFVQRKLNGFRVVGVLKMNEIELYTADGRRIKNFKNIIRSLRLVRDEFYRALPFLYEPILIDGHIQFDEFDCSMINASKLQFDNIDDAVFHIFDYLPWEEFQNGCYNQSLDDRMIFLSSVNDKLYNINNLEIESASLIIDLDDESEHLKLNDFTRQCKRHGYDGVILKRIFSRYTCTKSTAWMTYNLNNDYDSKS